MCIGQNLLATGNLSDYWIQWFLAFFWFMDNFVKLIRKK